MYKNYKFGAKPPKVDLRDHKLKIAGNPIAQRISKNLPDALTLTMPKVKDQGSVNSCVAHSAALIEEYFNNTQENDDSKLSVGFIYGTRYNYRGEGMYLRDALKTLQTKGCATNKEFPYNKEVPKQIELVESHGEFKTAEQNKISSYFRIDTSNIEDIKYALFQYGPVMASIKWHSVYEVYSDGCLKPMIDFNPNDDCGYHCITLTGYNEVGFIFQNSWGKDWGNKGKAILPYTTKIEEAWGIVDEIYRRDLEDHALTTDDDIKITIDTTNRPVLRFIVKSINYIINLFKGLYRLSR